MIWWYVEIFTYQTTLHINNKKPPQSASESLRCINTPQIRVIPAGLQQTMILISVFCMKASLWRSFHPSPVRIFVPCPLHDSMLPWNPCTLAPPNSKPPQWVDRPTPPLGAGCSAAARRAGLEIIKTWSFSWENHGNFMGKSPANGIFMGKIIDVMGKFGIVCSISRRADTTIRTHCFFCWCFD